MKSEPTLRELVLRLDAEARSYGTLNDGRTLTPELLAALLARHALLVDLARLVEAETRDSGALTGVLRARVKRVLSRALASP